MSNAELGKTYENGEVIMNEGEAGNHMYVIQEGQAEVVLTGEAGEVNLSILVPGDVFGEMAIFTESPRSATVRALGKVRVLTVDGKGFLNRILEDPSLAFRILRKMSHRIEVLNKEVLRLKGIEGRS